MRADQTAEKPVRRDTLAKGVGRIPAEYAGGAEVRPWVEGHSDPPENLHSLGFQVRVKAGNLVINHQHGNRRMRTRKSGGVRAGGGQPPLATRFGGNHVKG